MVMNLDESSMQKHYLLEKARQELKLFCWKSDYMIIFDLKRYSCNLARAFRADGFVVFNKEFRRMLA